MELLEPLAKFQRNVYSQNGEDGILEEILSRIGRIRELSGWCVEFGAWDGVFLSNTCRLIRESGYRALLIEPDPRRFAELCENFPNDKVVKFQSFVEGAGANSLDSLLAHAGCPSELDLISIDIDGCDYHVFESLRRFHPKIVCIEYNGTIPNDVDFVQPFDFALKWGASALALSRLAEEKGYRPVAVTTTNLIFVKNDLVDLVIRRESASLMSLRDDTNTRNFIFSGYDGTILTTDPVHLPWHNFTVPSKSLQVLPRPLRKFSGDYGLLGKAAFLTYVAMKSPRQLPSLAQLRERWVHRSR